VATRATLVGTAVAVVLLLVPALASAQAGPSQAEYDPSNEQVIEAAGSGGGSDSGGDSGDGGLSDPVVSSLPFTGFDLLAMGLGAIVITGTGLALRRLTRSPQARH
jgi:hypothetical protein